MYLWWWHFPNRLHRLHILYESQVIFFACFCKILGSFTTNLQLLKLIFSHYAFFLIFFLHTTNKYFVWEEPWRHLYLLTWSNCIQKICFAPKWPKHVVLWYCFVSTIFVIQVNSSSISCNMECFLSTKTWYNIIRLEKNYWYYILTIFRQYKSPQSVL